MEHHHREEFSGVSPSTSKVSTKRIIPKRSREGHLPVVRTTVTYAAEDFRLGCAGGHRLGGGLSRSGAEDPKLLCGVW